MKWSRFPGRDGSKGPRGNAPAPLARPVLFTPAYRDYTKEFVQILRL